MNSNSQPHNDEPQATPPVMNRISIDDLFASLNKSFQNKFNASINQSENTQNSEINFFKTSPNMENSQIVLQNSFSKPPIQNQLISNNNQTITEDEKPLFPFKTNFSISYTTQNQFQQFPQSFNFRFPAMNGNNDYSKVKISPTSLNFLPTEDWKDKQTEISLDSIISSFFHARCSSKIRFQHKVWNALQITLFKPQLFSIIGIKWASKTIIQVNKEVFGNFLDCKKVESGLFTSKGSFPSYGFIEISDVRMREELNNISVKDISECKFYEHRKNIFRMDSTESEINSIQSEGISYTKADPSASQDSKNNNSNPSV